MQYNGNYNSQDFEIMMEAIDEVAEYSIRFMHHTYPKFIKFINNNPDFVHKKIDKEHWIYKILKDNVYSIEYKGNRNDYDNSYHDFELLKKNTEEMGILPSISIPQSSSLSEFIDEQKVIRAASEAFIKQNKGVIDRINKASEPKRRRIIL